jgi:heterotetrameric sarcosine oxidase gamma subunit
MEHSELHALPRLAAAALAPCNRPGAGGCGVRLVEPIHTLALRLLPGSDAADLAAAARLAGLDAPAPGTFTGIEPALLWRNPTEWLFLTTQLHEARRLCDALPPKAGSCCHAVDQSDGIIVFELLGPGIDDVLVRLMDASAVPRRTGMGTRARLADIAAFVMRRSASSAWVVADRSNGPYLADWLAYAHAGVPEA